MVVVAVSKFEQGRPQFLQIPEAADPQELFLQRAEESFDAPVGLSCQLQRMATMAMQTFRSSTHTIR